MEKMQNPFEKNLKTEDAGGEVIHHVEIWELKSPEELSAEGLDLGERVEHIEAWMKDDGNEINEAQKQALLDHVAEINSFLERKAA